MWRHMSASDPVICKATTWFKFRAVVMLLMFGIFAGWFYLDGSVGYRKKNKVFFLHKTFEQASGEFASMNADGTLTPEEWRAHAAAQTVSFPEDRAVLPADLELPMPWPEILQDYERMKPLQWKLLWLDYTKEQKLTSNVSEKPYTAREIGEQWVVFWICLALSLGALFILLRTLGRSIRADDQGITSQTGKHVPYADLRVLDLRKWETKGLAFIDFDGSSGKGRLRIDGLTYGGFKAEDGEPAEQLMRCIRERFSGEILEYAVVSPSAAGQPESDAG